MAVAIGYRIEPDPGFLLRGHVDTVFRVGCPGIVEALYMDVLTIAVILVSWGIGFGIGHYLAAKEARKKINDLEFKVKIGRDDDV